GAELLRGAVSQHGQASIVVATGASQFEMLEALTLERDVPWHRITGFHLDEYVGLSILHPASFRRYLWERFVSKLPLPFRAFHFIDADENPGRECRRISALVSKCSIDVAFVGIGENGHLAFNDPPADFTIEKPYILVDLDEACRRQQLGEGWFPTLDEVPHCAISMSIRQIMRSSAIICTVPDERKAQAVRDALTGPVRPEVPASILQSHPDCRLFLDNAGASLLS
ncbi:MAG TPA: glucosamine-6-phosphate deaminase, partial [Verrucomicrobiales bacterium]|nr:glucosamine-6-phosphate deaminase [Verrucomicrobiales bacterium]